jgi:CRP/FNR family cyclic AMP-dependent transcriptional regulator
MLERVSLFSSLDDSQLAELEAICKIRYIPSNSIVINEGDETNSLYIVKRGKAYAVRIDKKGRQFVVNRFGKFDYFGEMSFFDGDVRCATVVTRKPCELIMLPRSVFLTFTERHPEILWNVTKALLAKLRTATEQIDALVFKDVYSRLARFLAEHKGPNDILTEKFTQQELADSVGTSRETINRIFNELITGGYINKQNGHIAIRKKLPYSF